jgi:hypothetical protein
MRRPGAIRHKVYSLGLSLDSHSKPGPIERLCAALRLQRSMPRLVYRPVAPETRRCQLRDRVPAARWWQLVVYREQERSALFIHAPSFIAQLSAV